MKCFFPTSNIEAYCFSFLPGVEDARMYLLRSNREVLCVDPSINQEAEELLADWKTDSCTVILTHEHYDHTSGVNRLREICKCNVICSDACANLIIDPRHNLSQYAEAQYILVPEMVRKSVLEKIAPFSCTADSTFTGHKSMLWDCHELSLFETPGHSKASICVCLDDIAIFTGDSLVPHTPVVTRLPGGNKREYQQKTVSFLRSLKKDMWVLPGHFDGDWLGNLIGEVM